jgi:hypothetical protein
MDINLIKKKAVKDQKYWSEKLEEKKEYAKKEEQWKKDLLKLNPEIPKPYKKP